MSRITNVFQSLVRQRAALIPFITAGDPDPDITVPLMHQLVAAGADLLEIGVPFSDPMADGPVIQQASERALTAGITPADVLDVVRRFREQNTTTPVILMGYLNTVEARGNEVWVRDAHDAGVFEQGERAGLAQKPLDALMQSAVGPKHLGRHRPADRADLLERSCGQRGRVCRRHSDTRWEQKSC